MRPVLAAACLALLAGCATQAPAPLPGPAVELSDVPFYPQARYQCGPAALATVLEHSGARVTPDALVPQVYVPGRRGSFQVELEAATRAYDRLPYTLTPTRDALFAEVADGRPVLVLQNLGVRWLPRWHYAVVVGYDPATSRVILRSGTTARRQEALADFLRSWARARNWALVSLRPGEIPVTATPADYLHTVSASEGHLPSPSLDASIAAGAARWPADADLQFAAANRLRARGEVQAAAEHYAQALEAQPAHLGALNNFADLLLAAGCPVAAASYLDRALAAAPPNSPLYPVLQTTNQEIAAARNAQLGADTGAACAALAGAPPAAT